MQSRFAQQPATGQPAPRQRPPNHLDCTRPPVRLDAATVATQRLDKTQRLGSSLPSGGERLPCDGVATSQRWEGIPRRRETAAVLKILRRALQSLGGDDPLSPPALGCSRLSHLA